MLYIRRRCYVTPGAHKACCCFQPHSAVSHCSLAATKGSKAVAACGQAWSPVSLHEAWCQWYNAVDIPKHDLEGWILNIKFTRDPIILPRTKISTSLGSDTRDRCFTIQWRAWDALAGRADWILLFMNATWDSPVLGTTGQRVIYNVLYLLIYNIWYTRSLQARWGFEAGREARAEEF